MNIRLRPFSQEDVPQVSAIELQSYTMPWSESFFRHELTPRSCQHGRVALAQETNEIVGYCFFWLIAEDELHINNIAVHPQYRRQGIATQLLSECIRMAREQNAHSLTLEVRESNHPARRFYEKMGFVVNGRRFKYYDEPEEDALILHLYLSKKPKSLQKHRVD